MLDGRRRTGRFYLLLGSFAEVEEQNRDCDSREQSYHHRGLVLYKTKGHHQPEQSRRYQPDAHCDDQAFEKVSRIITHTPREVLVDMNGRESLNPRFAETETFVSINRDCLPPACGDIEQ